MLVGCFTRPLSKGLYGHERLPVPLKLSSTSGSVRAVRLLRDGPQGKGSEKTAGKSRHLCSVLQASSDGLVFNCTVAQRTPSKRRRATSNLFPCSLAEGATSERQSKFVERPQRKRCGNCECVKAKSEPSVAFLRPPPRVPELPGALLNWPRSSNRRAQRLIFLLRAPVVDFDFQRCQFSMCKDTTCELSRA